VEKANKWTPTQEEEEVEEVAEVSSNSSFSLLVAMKRKD